MPKSCAPRYQVRLAETGADLAAADQLRQRCFRADADGDAPGNADVDAHGDWDAHDRLCRHVLVERVSDAAMVACFRVMPLCGGQELDQSYSAQFYDLSALRGYRKPMLELGRFCISPELEHSGDGADILRLAWAELTRLVDAQKVGMLFGCTSFKGLEPRGYHETFQLLHQRALAPVSYAPGVKAPEVIRFAGLDALVPTDRKKGLQMMPPLLRTYLTMGGWVSDHAVVDRDLGTLHVFTGLEIADIPPARARALRALVL